MDLYKDFHHKLSRVLLEVAKEKSVELQNCIELAVELPKIASQGDISTNIAMIYSKEFGLSSLEFAEILKEKIQKLEGVALVEVAKPGFLNISLEDSYFVQIVENVIKLGNNYGKGGKKNITVNVEYVSANPTGPLHIGHGRGAVVGDVLANLYEFLGYNITREYYINDAGAQIEILAKSLFIRYQEIVENSTKEIPQGYYPGEYLKNIAKKLHTLNPNLLDEGYGKHQEFIKEFAVEEILADIKKDMQLIGLDVAKHNFVSEKEVAKEENYKKVIDDLKSKDLLYQGTLRPPVGHNLENFEAKEQLLFRSEKFGDDIDRTVEKNDGTKTYFGNDIVYHYNKISRGFGILINVLGSDHIGYKKRLEAVVNAISAGKTKLSVVFCQLVNLSKGGQKLKMSKRAGNFLTLNEVYNMLGKDVFRFVMLTRKNDVFLDFDLELINQNMKDNPVFYIQYAYARICSVFKNAQKQGLNVVETELLAAKKEYLTEHKNIIKYLGWFSKMLNSSKEESNPHKIYSYLYELSSEFHSLWNKGKQEQNLKFLSGKMEKDYSNLAFLQALKNVVENTFGILGVELREEM